ncbi:MAG: hypothetical protein IPK78_18335 [Rhodospirillales bacterium]|nr:hypothetical protein [Rhodospirillales bacterium]
MPFLEVLTRCYRRPGMLAVNQASLRAQTCDDWTQTLLVDDVGRGIMWSYMNLAAYGPQIAGEYVWILDDDDCAVDPDLVCKLRDIARASSPDVIMLRMDHGSILGVLPDVAHWGGPPAMGHIGVSAFVVRREVWQTFAWVMDERAGYAADYEFIAEIWRSGPVVVWHDCVASRIQRRSFGAVE